MIFRIESTTDTPEVVLNAETNAIVIVGNCYPENAFLFFKPMIDWMQENHSLFTKPVRAEIKLNYFNSSSGRFLLKFLNITGNLLKNDSGFSVVWKFESGDELIRERGEELASVTDVPFIFVEI